MVQFKKREILFILILFVGVTTLVFSMGIFVGGIFVGNELRSLPPEKGNLSSADPLVSEKNNGPENPQTTDVIEKTLPSSETPQTPLLGGFTIQVSIEENYEEALTEVERLKLLGFPTVSIQEALMDNRKWFFVNLGYFQNEKKALNLASRLRQKGLLSTFLIRKSESQVHEEN